jgi:hypothetical protein
MYGFRWYRCIRKITASIHEPHNGQFLQSIPELSIRKVLRGFQKICFSMRLAEIVVFDLYWLLCENFNLWFSIFWLKSGGYYIVRCAVTVLLSV